MVRKGLKALFRPRRMLVVLPSWLGDTVMATPALRALRQEFSEAHICYLGREIPLAVLADTPWADETIEIRELDRIPAAREFSRTVKKIAGGNFDCAVLLPNSFVSALLTALAGVERRVGYDRDFRGTLLTDRLLPARDNGRFVPGPMIRYYLGLADYLGARCLDTRMELFTSAADERAVEAMLSKWGMASGVEVLVMHPGGGFGTSKRWPAERFAEVADALAEEFGMRVLISGTPGEAEVTGAVQKAMKNGGINLAGDNLSVGQFKALIGRSRLFIGNDTGPRHIAAALSVPVVTIFGSTDPAWTDTFFEDERIVQAKVSCGPCQKKVCKKEQHICMERITPQMVLTAARELLAKRRSRKGLRK